MSKDRRLVAVLITDDIGSSFRKDKNNQNSLPVPENKDKPCRFLVDIHQLKMVIEISKSISGILHCTHDSAQYSQDVFRKTLSYNRPMIDVWINRRQTTFIGCDREDFAEERELDHSTKDLFVKRLR